MAYIDQQNFSPNQRNEIPWTRFVSVSGPLIQILSSRVFLVAFLGLTMTTVHLLVQHHPEIIQNTAEQVYAYFCVGLLTLATAYIYLVHSRKLHRYSRAVVHYHFVNHTVRDTLAGLRAATESNAADSDQIRGIVSGKLRDVLTSISTCFSIITGQNCAVCVKALKVDGKVLGLQTVARDIISSSSRKRRDDDKNLRGQPMEYNTPCYSIFYSEKNEGRFFMHNNLPQLWARGAYKNIALKDLVPTYRFSLFGLRAGIRWKLPYKSVLVVPIRYRPADTGNASVSQTNVSEDFWGFLCIDSGSRQCFDYRLAPELAMAFGDILHVLLSQAAFLDSLLVVDNSKPN